MSGLFKKKGGRRNLRAKKQEGGSSSDEEYRVGKEEDGGVPWRQEEDATLLSRPSAAARRSGTNNTEPTAVGVVNGVDRGVGNEISAGQIPSASSCSSLLSFGQEDEDDEEGTVIKIKKSSHSRRLEKFRRKIRQQREEVEEDKNGACSIPASSQRQSPDSTVHFDASQKVRVEEADSTSGFIPEESEELAQSHRSVLEGGTIPDAQAVYLARKRRQRAREGGDFIPLDDTQRYGKNKSRLVREDENEESDMEEEGGSFYSSKKLRQVEEESRRRAQEEFLDVEQGESDEERDEEFAEWEREQIRKGVSSQQMQSLQQEQFPFSTESADNKFYKSLGIYEGNRCMVPTGPETKDPEPMDLDLDPSSALSLREDPKKKNRQIPKIGGGEGAKHVTTDDVILRLRSRLLDSGQVRRGRCLETEKLEDQLVDNEGTVSRLEALGPGQNDQYNLYQEMRGYCRDLLDCMNEKIDRVQSLDEEMTTLLRNRQDFLTRRRRQDVRDQFEECSAAGSGKIKILQEDAEKIMRTAEREARRTRRRQGREHSLGGLSHQDGSSSDDEEALSRVASFNSEKEKIVREASTVFEDTLEEFCCVREIVGRFTDWIEKDESSFQEAYIGLCLPKLLSPILRLHLLTWNPLEADCPALSSFAWFQEALTVGTAGMKNSSVVNLIPALVEKVICPKLAVVSGAAWDPTSSRQSGRLSALISSWVEEFPDVNSESKTVQRLLGVIQEKAKESLDDDLFMPIYGQDAIQNSATGAKAFLDRQFWFALKVFKNLLMFDGILSTSAVQELVLDGILNRHLVLGLQCSVFTDPATLLKCRTVVNAIPWSWTRMKSETVSRQLEPFSKVLSRIGEEIYKARLDSRRDAVEEIHKTLLKLGLNKQADLFAGNVRMKL